MERLKLAPPSAGSRYQNWKFQRVPGRMLEACGGAVLSRSWMASPQGEEITVGGLRRVTAPPTQLKPLPMVVSLLLGP